MININAHCELRERERDTQREDMKIMEPVGFVGIVKLTMQIILKNLKHFLCIALLLALPAALSLLLLDTSRSIKSLLASVSFLYKLLLSEDARSSAPAIDKVPQPHALGLEIALMAFSLTVSLTSIPLVTFSTCRACLGMRVNLEGSGRGIRISIGKLVVTILCLAAVYMGGVAVAAVVIGVMAAVGAAVIGGSAATVTSVVGVIAAGGVLVYLAVGMILAKTVAILEEARGWDAIRRSMYLVRQKKGATVGLLLLLWLCDLLLLPVLASDSWLAKGVGLGVQVTIALFGMVAFVVLYMSCKASLQEPLDSLVAASAWFGPLDSSQAKYLDLHTASLTADSV